MSVSWWSSTLRVASSLAATVEYLHSNDVSSTVHDLKPMNVGFDKQSNLKLFDFGPAAAATDNRVAKSISKSTSYV
jgi:serine/threonine protein kinase